MKKKKALKLVVVEDNNDSIVLLKKRFELLNLDQDMKVFDRGDEAFDYLKSLNPEDKEEIPDLIFLDLALPDQNGLDLLRQIKQLAEIRDVPVIVITASDAKEDIKQAYRLGGVLFMTKPWSHDVLKDALFHLKTTGRI